MTDYGATYRYVDTAQGGVNQRNHVKDVTEVQLNGVRRECYASYMRASDELVDYLETHRNASGRPSVGGFPGKTWTDALRLDFDYESDPSRALFWLRKVCARLESMGVNLRAVRFYFSGNKGFHAEIPATLFGGFEPSTHLHRDLKRVAAAVMRDIPFDGSVYDKLRLWRLPNSQHGKSGLYKIQLTAREVLDLDYADIRDLAVRPRDLQAMPELAPIADDEWDPVPDLVALWRNLPEPPEVPIDRSTLTPAVPDDDRDAQTVSAIATAWPRHAEGMSRHADYLLPLAGFLCAHTSPEHALHLIRSGAVEANDTSFLAASRGWQAEIQRIVVDTARKFAETEEPVSGLPTIRQQFPGLAVILEVLWPELELNPPPAAEPAQAEPKPSLPAALIDGDYPLQTLAQLVTTTEVTGDQLVESILWANRITWAYASPGVGKTLFLLAMAMHLAGNRPFCGRAVTAGPVLMIEEDSPLTILAEYTTTIADIYDFNLAELPFWVNRAQGLRIVDEAGLARAIGIVEQCPILPILVIIDACERITPSDRFNSKEFDPLTRFMQWLIGRGATVVVIDHTKRPATGAATKNAAPVDPMELLYGGRAKQAIADVMMHFSGALGTGVRVSYTKFRGETPSPIDLTFSGDAGFTVRDNPKRAMTKTEQQIMAFINNHLGEWHQLGGILEATKIPERTARRALDALVRRRWLLKQGAKKEGTEYRNNPSLPGAFE